ncbi:MAG: XrtB/PEP-CTERM-associated transcriptional regulator EpsA [Pseudomonadota bacterium]
MEVKGQASAAREAQQSVPTSIPDGTHGDDSGTDGLVNVLHASATISSHFDLYYWLQTRVRQLLPHKSMLAVWGDFEAGQLHYDIASKIPGVSTRGLRKIATLNDTVTQIHERASKTPGRWYLHRDLDQFAQLEFVKANVSLINAKEMNLECLLVYSMRDERNQRDCLYVFAMEEKEPDLNPVVLDLLIPHIDMALRRIECLEYDSMSLDAPDEALSCSLSAREREVLTWVSEGKSNEEIGAILGISRNTVKNHLKRIFGKMGVTARSQAVSVYLRQRSDFV